MSDDRYSVRVMTAKEVSLATAWAEQEGWNPGDHDALCYAQADPEGFLVGLLDGEPIACISAIKYDDQFGFIGFYIVKPEYRGRGYGIQIWEAAMRYLEGCNIGLDGVVDQQENYQKTGFHLAYRNVRYEGVAGDEREPRVDPEVSLMPLTAVPFEIIEDYDRSFFPSSRPEFLNEWIQQLGNRSKALMQDGKMIGYAVMRKCATGYKVGPLYAESVDRADLLFSCLKAELQPTENIYLDVPEVNAEAVALAERHGLSTVFETARMYTQAIPDLPLDQIFGVTSFEIG